MKYSDIIIVRYATTREKQNNAMEMSLWIFCTLAWTALLRYLLLKSYILKCSKHYSYHWYVYRCIITAWLQLLWALFHLNERMRKECVGVGRGVGRGVWGVSFQFYDTHGMWIVVECQLKELWIELYVITAECGPVGLANTNFWERWLLVL